MYFLDHVQFPKGAVGTLWESENVLKEQPRTILLHNNWIKGLKSKIPRMMQRHDWFYDRKRLMCNYSERLVSATDWDVQEDGSDWVRDVRFFTCLFIQRR